MIHTLPAGQWHGHGHQGRADSECQYEAPVYHGHEAVPGKEFGGTVCVCGHESSVFEYVDGAVYHTCTCTHNTLVSLS